MTPLDRCDVSAVHDFGRTGPGRASLVQTGWLGLDTLVELKVYEPDSIRIWKKKHADKELYIKVTPVDVALAAQQSFSVDLDESVDISETRMRNKAWPLVNVAVRHFSL